MKENNERQGLWKRNHDLPMNRSRLVIELVHLGSLVGLGVRPGPGIHRPILRASRDTYIVCWVSDDALIITQGRVRVVVLFSSDMMK